MPTRSGLMIPVYPRSTTTGERTTRVPALRVRLVADVALTVFANGVSLNGDSHRNESTQLIRRSSNLLPNRGYNSEFVGSVDLRNGTLRLAGGDNLSNSSLETQTTRAVPPNGCSLFSGSAEV